MKILRGKIESGTGDFAPWILKLNALYEQKTGMKLYPGTLNVRLSEAYAVPKGCLRLEAHEYGGSVSVNIVPCRLLGRRAFILRTDANEQGTGSHPRTIVEIASDVKLREAGGLSEGDEVSIEVND
jgi:CTP-dependent riboflavin kinase